MQIKLISTVDRYGGAGLAAFRLFDGLKREGEAVELLVQDKSGNELDVVGPQSLPCKIWGKLMPFIDPAAKLVYTKRHRGAWSCNLYSNPCFPFDRIHQANIVHLHWVCGGFLPIHFMKNIQKPIVWTLHDAWPFTGGCHLPFTCRKYEKSCGDCPQLNSGKENDLSRRIWLHKKRSWQDLEMSIVAPSTWMASSAASSSLFSGRDIKVIPNGLDTALFAPIDSEEARHRLGLAPEGRYLLFSAMGGIGSWAKGGDLLVNCLKILKAKSVSDFTLLVAGSDRAQDFSGVPFKVMNLGRMSVEMDLPAIYSAADLTLVPSRSESLGYVAIESMACGTPCVAFNNSGMTDVIDHLHNGYLAQPFDVSGLAEGALWLLSDAEKYCSVAYNAREKVLNAYSLEVVARQYFNLYEEIVRAN